MFNIGKLASGLLDSLDNVAQTSAQDGGEYGSIARTR